MTGKTERVILLKGDATKWYDQAIFIVNKNTPATKMPVDFVAEAEKIIANYLRVENKKQLPKNKTAAAITSTTTPKKIQQKIKPKNSTFDFTLNLIMIFACIAIAIIFAYGLLR